MSPEVIREKAVEDDTTEATATERFNYELPEELIAQHPLADRDASRLMLLGREDGNIEDASFADFPSKLSEGDILILNDTKVIPAKLVGTKQSGGRVELLLVRSVIDDGVGDVKRWQAMAKPAKGLRPGTLLSFAHGLGAKVIKREDDWAGERPLFTIEIILPSGEGDIYKLLDLAGSTPLPPYIKREDGLEDDNSCDRERYQTVFASVPGAVAAPTAGLHFTEEILDLIASKGVKVRRITLHTGPGTFLPVRAADIREHKMAEEEYKIDEALFREILETKRAGGRVVAVGTTATRALESSVVDGLESPRLSGLTDLFIRPGFEFKLVDALLTNFHLPGSTLIMLVSAFAGTDNVLNAYAEAVKERYRFYSYGDAIFIS